MRGALPPLSFLLQSLVKGTNFNNYFRIQGCENRWK